MRAEAVVSLLQSDGLLVVRLDDMDSGLVLVHGVEDELETKSEKDRTMISQQSQIDSQMLSTHTYITARERNRTTTRALERRTTQHKLKPLPKEPHKLR